MTYGETGGAIRGGLTQLLHQQRLQYRLSNDPRRFTNRTVEQRQLYGDQIRRYRRSVLVWCHQATIAADPYLGSNEFFAHHKSRRGDGPYDFLRLGLERVLDASTSPLPAQDELSKPHEVELVESWRKIGAAAARGEHDFSAGLGHGRLSAAQCHTVMKDIAAIVQGLVILDHRYAQTPGWEKLRNGGHVGWSALAASLEASIGPPDYTVDHRGWRPPLRFIRGPARPGLVGVLQAEQNLLVRLTDGTAPVNLRVAVAAQTAVSTDLAARTTDPDLRERWKARAETHDLIHRALRDVVGGHAHHGAGAAREANNLITRVAGLARDVTPDAKMLAAFDKRFIRIDARISELIEDGIHNKTILRRTKLPRVDVDSPAMIKPLRERVAPIETPSDSELMRLVGMRLRPGVEAMEPPPDAARSRSDLFSALVTEAPSRTSGVPRSGRSSLGG